MEPAKSLFAALTSHLAGVAPELVRASLPLWSVVVLPRDTLLWRQGQPADALALVDTGALEVAVDGTIVAAIGPGELIGETAIFARTGVRFASVRARVKTRVIILPSAGLARLRAHHDPFYRVLLAAVIAGVAARTEVLDRHLAQVRKGNFAEPPAPEDTGVLARLWPGAGGESHDPGARPPLGALLAADPAFAHVDPDARDQLVRAFQPRAFRAGEALVRQGDRDSRVSVLATSRAHVLKTIEDHGEALLLGVLEPGMIFGINSFVRDVPRSASIVAAGDGWCYEMTRARFAELPVPAAIAWEEITLAVYVRQYHNTAQALQTAIAAFAGSDRALTVADDRDSKKRRGERRRAKKRDITRPALPRAGATTDPFLARRDDAPARPRPRVRPQIRTAAKIPWTRYLRRALTLWGSMLRLFLLGFGSRLRGGDQLARDLRQARLLRGELERLGGVFVKVGQLLSVRTDQFPWEVCREYTQLLDRVVPFPGAVAEQVLAGELGTPVAELFERFDPQPIAAASIGQVHVAWLRGSGAKVAIKIRRPGIAEQVGIDLALMRGFARFVDLVSLGGQVLTPTIDELRRIMDEELSYLNEARATHDFRRTLKGRKHIYAPKVYFDYTTDSVLTMEFVEGISASVLIRAIENQDTEALARLERLGIDRQKLARRFFRSVLEQIYEHDICHIDPHPGNLILMPKNRICMIDFGAVGYFGPSMRARMERVTVALAGRDVDGAVEAMLESWEPLPMRDIEGFKSELKPIYLRLIQNASSKHGDPNYKSNGRMLVESARLAGKYGIQAPWEMLRFTRLFWEYDTIVVALAPEFNFIKAARSYFVDRARRRMRGQISRQNLAQLGSELTDLITRLPRDAAELRHQAFAAFRRGGHLYQQSMSKLSLVGKLLIEYTMLALVAALGALAYYRITAGPDALAAKLAELLPFALPWWVWALFFAHLLMRLQRLRSRLSEID